MIVLDTHILIWWVNGDASLDNLLKKGIESAIQSGEQVAVSSLTFFEIALLVKAGRVKLKMDVGVFSELVIQIPGFVCVPFDAQQALIAGTFEVGDFIDKAILALCKASGGMLMSQDKNLLSHPDINSFVKV